MRGVCGRSVQAERSGETDAIMAYPWMKWFGSKWRSDPQLAGCCSATRGIWADAVSAMQEQGTGTLTGTIDVLARMLRATPPEMASALAELKATGTADITEHEMTFSVTCRRLSREYSLRKQWRERQNRHRGENVTQESRGRSKKLDVRSKKEDTDPGSASPPGLMFDFEAVYALYPRKEGRKKGLQRCRSQIKTREKYDALLRAVKNYSAKVTDPQYLKHFDSFMGCWEDYADGSPALLPLKQAPSAVRPPPEYHDPKKAERDKNAVAPPPEVLAELRRKLV